MITTPRRKETRKSVSGGSTIISTYLDSLQAYPQLKHEALIELFQVYEAGGEEAERARKKLTESNLRLVVSIAKQFNGQHAIPLIDLIQEGNLGLMKAIERFDWKRGYRFSTYATWWIKQAIGQYVLRGKRIIRLPAHAATIQRRLISAAEEYKATMGCEPTQAELFDIVGASETVAKATIRSSSGIVSLQEPCKIGGMGDGSAATWESRIEDPDPSKNPFEAYAHKESAEIVQRVLDALTPKENAILRLRYGLIDVPEETTDYQITEQESDSISEGRGLE